MSLSQTYIGVIQNISKYPDPEGRGRIPVYIEELMTFNYNQRNKKFIWCDNTISNYTIQRSESGEYIRYGNYTPLYEGTKVSVNFSDPSNINTGYISAFASDISSPIDKDLNEYYCVARTKDGSEIYLDNKNNIIHLMNARGMSNVRMTKDSITLSINNRESETNFSNASSMILDEHGLTIVVGDKRYEFTDTGVRFSLGEGSKSFFDMTKKGLEFTGGDHLKIQTAGELTLSADRFLLDSLNEMHLNASDLRLTGTQKAQLSGTTVNVQGFLTANLKALHVGIDSLISTDTKTIINNQMSLINNNQNIINNTNTTVNNLVTGIDIKGAGTIVEDGLTLKNMGIGSSTSASISASVTATTTSIYLTLATIGTALLMNDPFTGIVNNILSKSIAGTAEEADTTTLFNGIFNKDIKEETSTIATSYLKNEINLSKMILPSYSPVYPFSETLDY